MLSGYMFPDIDCNISNSSIIFIHRMRPFNAIVVLLIHFQRANIFVWFKNQNENKKYTLSGLPPPVSLCTPTPLGNHFFKFLMIPSSVFLNVQKI